MARSLYDPQLTPERTIIAEKQKLLNDIRNAKQLMCTRMGEQYFLGCSCGEYQITSDLRIVNHYFEDHQGH